MGGNAVRRCCSAGQGTGAPSPSSTRYIPSVPLRGPAALRPCFALRRAPVHDSDGSPLPQKTYNAKPGEIDRAWYVVDADGETLGRLATRIADTLRGKKKPQYTPHVDTGDFVIVVNCDRIRVTGNKLEQKVYY